MIRFFLHYGQGIILMIAGCATLWWSSDLMTLLIQVVGEENALGADNVIQLENGGTLLTNPAAMVGWTIPIWILGSVQMSAGLTLLWNYHRRNLQQPNGAETQLS